MITSLQKTVRTAGKSPIHFTSTNTQFLIIYPTHPGVRGLFDGISGTWMRQMSYSLCRFWAYDESKKFLGAGKDAPAWKLAAAGSMGAFLAPLPLILLY